MYRKQITNNFNPACALAVERIPYAHEITLRVSLETNDVPVI